MSEEEDPLRFRFPKWFGSLLVVIIGAIASVVWDAHNRSIAMERDFNNLKETVKELRENQVRNGGELEKLRESNGVLQEKVLNGINELVQRQRQR